MNKEDTEKILQTMFPAGVLTFEPLDFCHLGCDIRLKLHLYKQKKAALGISAAEE